MTAGSATIHAHSAAELEVRQTSARAILEWESFSIGAGEHTHFAQPSADAIALNRVRRGGEISEIFGRLSADGRVVLVNGAGIYFGPSAHVDVGGLVATTADVDDAAFLAASESLAFAGGGGAVTNAGAISARDAGLLAFVAPWVENTGTIEARLGRIVLASGEAFTLDLAGDGLLEIALPGAADAQRRGIESAGLLAADGGTIALLSAEAGRTALDGAINLTGVARAQTLESRAGRIVLGGGASSQVRVSGTLDATGRAAGAGGVIEVTGGSITLAGGALLDASGAGGGGQIRVGGDFQGTGDLLRAQSLAVESGAALRADALASGAGGRIIAWSDGHTDFAGALSARGQGDVGGFAEISGHQTLSLTGDVDLGAGGHLLLDPVEIRIGSGANATLTTDTLRRQLIAGTDVDLLATDDIVLDALLDARVNQGGVAGGDVTLRSTNGNVVLNADLITNRGAVTLDAGLDVLMASSGGALSGDGVAIVVSDGATGIGSEGIVVRAGGGASLEYLATAGALDLQATGNLALARNLGTLANPIASLVASGAGVDLPAGIITANGGVAITASGALAMLASDQIFVSDGSGSATKGLGGIALSYGAGDLDVGDVETAGTVAIDYTGAGSSTVRLTQQLGGANAPIGGLDVDAPVVDQAAQIVAQGDVRLGRAGATGCSGTPAGCTILRHDIFTRGGAFEVRSDALVDPRRALVDASGNPFTITPVVGLTDLGNGQGALVFGASRSVQTVNELAVTQWTLVPVRAVNNGVADPDPATSVPFAERTVVTLVQDNTAVRADGTTLQGLFPNLRQEVDPNRTSEGGIGERVDSTWILTIDTTNGNAAGTVAFDGVVTAPDALRDSQSRERQATGILPGTAFDRVFEQPGSTCAGLGCSIFNPTNRWTSVNPVFDPQSPNPLIAVDAFEADSLGISEFVELGIVAGNSAVTFGQRVDGESVLQLNIESAGSLVLPASLPPGTSGSAFLDCASEVSCFGALRIPRALIASVDPQFEPPPPVNDPFPFVDVLDQSEPTHFSVRPFTVPISQERRAAWLENPGFVLVADGGIVDPPASAVALITPRPGYITNPTTGTFTSTPDSGAGRTGSAGSFSFSGGAGGLFGGGAGLGGAGGLPGGDDAAVSSTSAIQGEGVALTEEDPASAGDESCPQAAPSAYQATPGQAAFGEDARGGPFSVDVFCGGYRLVEAAPASAPLYGELPFVARDFWESAGLVNTRSEPTPSAP